MSRSRFGTGVVTKLGAEFGVWLGAKFGAEFGSELGAEFGNKFGAELRRICDETEVCNGAD